jgi:hypothetical protein
MKPKFKLSGVLFTILFTGFSIVPIDAQEYTRGIGLYPGNPNENFSPRMQIDRRTYRNLALNRAAYHSSSYNYNLTAQLITDGIITTDTPLLLSTATSSKGTLARNERLWLIDNHSMTNVSFEGSSGWVQIERSGQQTMAPVDSVFISGNLRINDQEAEGWSFTVKGSNDCQSWETLATAKGDDYPGREFRWFFARRGGRSNFRVFNQGLKFEKPTSFHFYRSEFQAPNVTTWGIADMILFADKKQVELGSPFNFTSAWKSAGKGTEWVYVDLGAICTFDRIVLHWIQRAAAGTLQISDDAVSWNDVKPLLSGSKVTDDFKFEKPLKARFVRVLMTTPASDDGYLLSELEVYGRGGPVAVPKPMPAIKDNKRMNLAGGAWRLQRASLVNGDGKKLSQPGFDDKAWIAATVPATVLMSYLNVGAVPDPNYADNQLMISESFFYSDFWYRNEFAVPASFQNKHLFLNFDGINWKADIFMNGHKLGRIEGAFTRGRFDITHVLKPGEKNVIVVRIEKNAMPGATKEQTALSPDKNGGALGADNPTYHASVGWDWIPTIRGRNIGIWNDVFLSTSGAVTVENPFVSIDLPLPDTSFADVHMEVTVVNHDTIQVKGRLHGTFGSIAFATPVTLRPSETKLIKLNPYTHPALRLKNPKLWWPNGYGKQDLYDVNLWFEADDHVISDVKSFKAGVREMAYSELDDILKIWINGRRFIGRGGNWGFPESNLSYRDREYDIAVRYHKDMNFTIIRNWVGQTGDDAFYEACDRHGIMVWQDFWLANPVDGPNPNDNEMFLANAKDFVLRIRNHPSIALYCGRNEGNPPPVIDDGIREIIPKLHPGLHYISNSAFGVVSGGGPYRAQPLKFYFERRATPKFHSEMGMPNIVPYESYRLMIPDSAAWPQGRMWGVHDFCLEGAQGGSSFIEQMNSSFGPINNVKDWLSLAQWVNYQGYRVMFEAQSKHRMGLLLWMSHPAWPSFVWQTYDYYFEPTAAYFGCKKASEPLHIQWNVLSDSIEVVNYNSLLGANLTAKAELINLEGVVQWQKEISLNCPIDNTVRCFPLEYPDNLSAVYFIRLKLFHSDNVISENLYWRGSEEGTLKAVRSLPKVALQTTTKVNKKGDRWLLTTDLKNTSTQPVLMVRLKVVREKSGDRILPALYSDNYLFLFPGDRCMVTIEVADADTRGEKPDVIIEGLNVR